MVEDLPPSGEVTQMLQSALELSTVMVTALREQRRMHMANAAAVAEIYRQTALMQQSYKDTMSAPMDAIEAEMRTADRFVKRCMAVMHNLWAGLGVNDLVVRQDEVLLTEVSKYVGDAMTIFTDTKRNTLQVCTRLRRGLWCSVVHACVRE